MDRLNDLRGQGGGFQDSSPGNTSDNEGYLTANESSRYFSLSEVDSTFDISSLNDVSITSTSSAANTHTSTNLSPIGKNNDLLDSYKIGKHIEAANILSGGVSIFDNENSYDGLVIDDNGTLTDEKPSSDKVEDVSSLPFEKAENVTVTVDEEAGEPSRDTEVVLQIDGKNVNAIDIGNGLYLYRKEGEEELAAVQIIDDEQQPPSFKFLKVRENAEGNLEVYEEIQIEVPKEVPDKDDSSLRKNISHVPIKDINKVIGEAASSKVTERNTDAQQKETPTITSNTESEPNQDEVRTEVSLNLKVKLNEARKSPLIGYTPMTFHSTPIKEGIPLTKTMVDQQLHPKRASDNIKKTIEVHTDNCKQKLSEIPIKIQKELVDNSKKSDSIMKEKGLNDKLIDSQIEIQCNTKKSEEYQQDENKSKYDKNTQDLKCKEVDKKEKVITRNDCQQRTNIDRKSENVNNEKECLEEDFNESENTGNTELSSKHMIQKAIPLDIKDSNIHKNNSDVLCDLNVSEKCNNVIKSLNTDPEKDTTRLSDLDSNQKCELPLANNDINTICEVLKTDNKINNTSSQVKVNADVKIISDDNLGLESQLVTRIEEIQKVDIKPLLTTGYQKKTIEICKKDDEKSSSVETVNSEKKPLFLKSPKKDKPNIECPKESIVINDEKKEANESLDKKSHTDSLPDKEEKSTVNLINPDQKINKPCRNDNINITKVKPILRDKIDEKTTCNLSNPSHYTHTPCRNDNIYIAEVKPKPITNNNSHGAVPFGKWTEANRQEFLNKIKETKIPIHSSSSNQIKNSNDLNRRDVLKKIDSQRQTVHAAAKAQELIAPYKQNIKNETPAFSSKSVQENKALMKNEIADHENKKIMTQEISAKDTIKPQDTTIEYTSVKETIVQQQLIDKTIEDMIRTAPSKHSLEDTKSTIVLNNQMHNMEKSSIHISDTKSMQPISLDDIERKMNELHGIPFKERPAHELPRVISVQESKKSNSAIATAKILDDKSKKVPHLLPIKTKFNLKDCANMDSEEEIIEHEPVTGDIDTNTKCLVTQNISQTKTLNSPLQNVLSDAKTDAIITEKDFEKFARRNSVTLENCITVKFDSKEPHKVVQSVKEKNNTVKLFAKNDVIFPGQKNQVPKKRSPTQNHQVLHTTKIKKNPVNEDTSNKNHPSKLQRAYQSVLTAKRQMESPITVIEDKPVKVVFMDTSVEYIPTQLNVQGKELSPAKKLVTDSDLNTDGTGDSLDTDILEAIFEGKEEVKAKSKHQRKQVLTPVDNSELELIEPADLGIEISPKKKRKTDTDDSKLDRSPKNIVPKKSYLLGRGVVVDNTLTANESITQDNTVIKAEKVTVSALDNLVKAAELIENQSENKIQNLQTPAKRGRGRPRKYPLPDDAAVNQPTKEKASSPQKKPRLMDIKPKKPSVSSTDDDETDDEFIRENWTMGKINENIVCPICNKLFRSENVVFKHVKHCTGPSPNRSDADRRNRAESQEIEIQSSFSDKEDHKKSSCETPKKRKSKESSDKIVDVPIIIDEDKPHKEKQEKVNTKQTGDHKTIFNKTADQPQITSLICEICGKMFRQLSYLVNHKLKHKKDVSSNNDIVDDKTVINRTDFRCETCNKDFRKLHHLVQHRLIHKPETKVSSRTSRKESWEHKPEANASLRTSRKESWEKKDVKISNSGKQNEEQSAGFRCELCDKSFRKLHHLVEHRETHGINRQKSIQITDEKSSPQCDVCKKTFRKLHYLIEHKEQHLETSSEKSDSKSSLSTKDIIHECSLCYMVFPNEHSLNKHTIICQRKKKQAEKKSKEVDGISQDKSKNIKSQEENTLEIDDDVEIVAEEKSDTLNIKLESKSVLPLPELADAPTTASTSLTVESQKEIPLEKETTIKEIESIQKLAIKRDIDLKEINTYSDVPKTALEVPMKLKKTEDAKETPLKKSPNNSKIVSTVIKRKKSVNVPLPVIDDLKVKVESSDDDDVRYMINPDFNLQEQNTGKTFLKVKANKRNSLKFEMSPTKDLVKRRMSIQHPPKIPRLKSKEEPSNTITNLKNNLKTVPKLESLPSIESDESDVKYSFPETLEINGKAKEYLLEKDKIKVERKKSLTGIAKRKSLGKLTPQRKNIISAVKKEVKRRITQVEHRCDCGQLFSSAALLARHTTLAHTPPRIRRRRSPPPDTTTTINTKTVTKPKNATPLTLKTRKSSVVPSQIPTAKSRKLSVKSDAGSNSNVKSRKSSADVAQTLRTRKSSVKTDSPSVKQNRTRMQTGVPK